jgi:hypothetical protein
MMPSDEAILKSWGLTNEYQKNHEELVFNAKTAYMVLCRMLGFPPSISELQEVYGEVLCYSRIFLEIVQRKSHLNPAYYKEIAKVFSRYVVQEDWLDISSVPCP